MRINFFCNKKLINIAFISLLSSIFLAATFCCISPVIANFAVGNSNKEQCDAPIKMPIIMYHLVLKKTKGENKFIISESTFEEDLKYLSDNGYTTILVKDLIDYVENKKNLPEKPIMIMFDDGAYNNYLYCFPLAKKYNAKFIFSPIGKHADRYSEVLDDNPRYAHASWNYIKEMADSDLVEIQNHTYDMHSEKGSRVGCRKKKSESAEKYRQELSNDLVKMQNLIMEKTSKTPTAFIYPFGACSECSKEILKELGFKATFLCENKMNYITRDPNSLYCMYRFLRPPRISSESFFAKILK